MLSAMSSKLFTFDANQKLFIGTMTATKLKTFLGN
jgi:hypothetical protein